MFLIVFVFNFGFGDKLIEENDFDIDEFEDNDGDVHGDAYDNEWFDDESSLILFFCNNVTSLIIILPSAEQLVVQTSL